MLGELNIYHENILHYIAGYIVLTLMPRIKCAECKDVLIAKSNERLASSDHNYVHVLTLASFTVFVNGGKLLLPSNSVFEVIKTI